jgi:hypothetical protein
MSALKLRRAFLILLLAMLPLLAPRRAAADCTSASCSDCETDRRGLGVCLAVNDSASCSCSIDTKDPAFCILEGACTYSGGGGGGTGGGGGGGAGGCVQIGGSWCPAECTSCQTIFF